MNSRAILTTVLIWLVLTTLFAAIGFLALDWQKWHGLARDGVEIKGIVVAKEPENHRSIRYSYLVGERTYSGIGSAGGDNPQFEHLNVGDRVIVFFNPANPEESILGNAESQAGSITAGVLFLAIVGPAFSMMGLYAKGWLPVRRRGRI